MAEEKFERAVIDKLKSEGWTYRKDLSGVNDAKLYEHWREILNKNNAAKLNGVPISDTEFNLIQLELGKNKTPYDAQLVLAGAGGIGTLPLNRDDGSQIELEIFYGDDVAGGKSEYEVVNQITFPNLPNSLGQNRRIDIMLLISGIPVAHIEEKDEHLQSQWNAFEQLKKYDSDGMYLGLFSFVQVFFILSQNSSHYFARPKNVDSYNRDYVFGWRDDDGKDITNSMEFIHQTLGIPALHRLVTAYMIPDASNDNLMVMRSYQIQATRSILDRMKEMDNNGVVEREGGYVWHTTGSGKTVTSFKVAQLLASMPKVRNVLFIVDRVDLVNQTFENFKSFAYTQFEKRIKIVKGHELKKVLNSKDAASQILLITVQGLAKAANSGLKSDERMVILMDEAHRSASGASVEKIKEQLPKTTWFGFTGTPNFYSDEVNDVKTTRDVSTHDIFGQRLHRYTIKDAIGDGNVLGFDVTYYESSAQTDEENKLTEAELEKGLYLSTDYRRAVVSDIINNWKDNSSGPVEAGIRKPNEFQAMFAVSGKQAVAAYYELFKEMAPELRVAISYSRDEENGEGSVELQNALKKSMKEYSEFYKTQNFLDSKEPERDYLNDITKRLARKKPYNRGLEADRLDLIIVSDQLLTGFDSKYVNVIYMDKTLKEGLLIQAMSRTNRTFNKDAKPYGKVRFFRKGELMKHNVENALVIYTMGGNDTLDDDKNPKPTAEQLELILAPKMYEKVKELIPKIEKLKEIAGEDFSITPKSEKERIEFAQEAVKVNSAIQRLVQQGYDFETGVDIYDEHGNKTGEKIKLNIDSQIEQGSMQARLNDVNELLPPEIQVDLSNIKVAIETLSTEIINYDKLVDLLNAYIDKPSEENRKAVEEHITPMDDENRSGIMKILDNIKNGFRKVHFNTESLKEARSEVREEQQELDIRRWSADNNYNGNEIVEAFELYLPGVDLNNNSKLNDKVQQLEKDSNVGFFERAEFEKKLLEFFEKL